MKEIGRGKEFKLELFDNFNVLIGTVDNKNPEAVYVKLSAWAEPTDSDNDINYSSVIRKLDKAVRSHTFKNININNFDNNLSIVDLDLRESGIVFNKRSFVSCELTLFQKGNHQVNSDFMTNELSKISKKLIDDVFNQNEHFKFHLKKK